MITFAGVAAALFVILHQVGAMSLETTVIGLLALCAIELAGIRRLLEQQRGNVVIVRPGDRIGRTAPVPPRDREVSSK